MSTKEPKDVRRVVSIRMRKDIHRKLKQQAEKKGTTLSHEIETTMAEKIGMDHVYESDKRTWRRKQ